MSNEIIDIDPSDVSDVFESNEEQTPKGAMIYIPHNCEIPIGSYPIGSIWQCLGEQEGVTCNDHWEFIGDQSGVYWKRIKRGRYGGN